MRFFVFGCFGFLNTRVTGQREHLLSPLLNVELPPGFRVGASCLEPLAPGWGARAGRAGARGALAVDARRRARALACPLELRGPGKRRTQEQAGRKTAMT